MENNEKYILRNLKDHREDIDLDDLWAEVSPHIPKEKKRKRIGFWFFGILLVGAMMISLSWFNSKSLKADGGQQVAVADDVNVERKNTENIANPAQLGSVKSADEKSIDSNKKIITPATKQNEKNNSFSTKRILEEENTDINLAPDGSKILKTLTKKVGISERETKSNSAVIPARINSSKKIKQQYSTNESTNSNSGIRIDRRMISPQRIIGSNLELLDFKRSILLSQLDLTVPEVNQYSSRINKWSIYALGGVAIAKRNLTAMSPEAIEERDRRTAVVDVLGAWQIEGGIGFRLSPKLKVMTGLNYTQIHEKASYSTDDLVDVEIQTENQILKQDGSVETENEAYTGQGIRRIQETRYNQFKVLQIPIKLSYELVNINKIKVNVGGLFSYGVKQQYEGFTSLSASRGSYDLLLDQDNKFRTSGSLSYGLFFTGTTYLSEMVDFSFGVGYKQTKHINTEIYLIDQQYNLLTFTSSISRRF